MRFAIALLLAACGTSHFNEANGPGTPTCEAKVKTAVIGPGSIEDADIWQGEYQPNPPNSGGAPILAMGRMRRNLLRIDPEAIPEGAITAFRMRFTAIHWVRQATSQFYFVADANTWTEGTANWEPQPGSVCWSGIHCLEQSWAGSPGGSTPGVDYDADANPPSITVNGLGVHYADLNPSWPALWRNGERVNNGLLMVSIPMPYEDASDVHLWSSESGTDPLTFEIDYVEGAGCGE